MADETPAGYSTAEKLAGIVGAILFLGLALIAVDLATGGKVFRARKQPCGCQDTETEATGAETDVSGP